MAEWTWTPHLDGPELQKATRTAWASGLGAIACVAFGILFGDARFSIVLGVVIGGIFVLGRLSTRQVRSLTATVDDGVLTLTDLRATTRVDLREAASVQVRRRNASQADRQWVVEAIGPGGATTHRIAALEAYWAAPEATIDELRRGIAHYHGWYRQHGGAAATDANVGAAASPTGSPITTPGATYEWRPRRHEHADRNQRRVLWTTVVLAVAIAVYAAISNWGDVVGVILSVLVVPGLVLLLGLGLWYAYTPGKAFRLAVVGGVLQAWRGDKLLSSVPLAGASDVIVDTTTTVSSTSTGSARSTHSWVQIVRADGAERIALPSGLGIAMNLDDKVVLEAELRRIAGLG